MSSSTDGIIDDIIESLDRGISVHGGNASLTYNCRESLRANLTQLVWEIKEEIRNEANQ